MKRLAILLCVLCLLCGAASAEGLRVLDMWNECDAYQAAFPGREVEQIETGFDDEGHSKAQRFLLENPDGWDVAIIWTDDCDLATLDEAGLLMNLSDEAIAADRVGNMYPAIRGAVSDGERLLAVPTHLYGAVMQLSYASTYYDKDILPQLGLTREDAPHTFDELCDLAQRYMALPKETRKGTVFHIDAAASNPKNYFLYYLIELYTSQYCDANGNVAYDTPEFRHALISLEAMATALKNDPKITYGQGGSVYGLVSDASSALLNEGGVLYLRLGDNESIPARMGMLIVNANTAHKDEALEFVSFAAKSHDAQMGPLLLEVFDYDALARASYDEDIQAQIYQKENQSVIDKLERERDSGKYTRYYSRESIADYAVRVAPHLTFPRMPRMDVYAIAKEYVQGKLDVEGLITKLNGIAAENAVN